MTIVDENPTESFFNSSALCILRNDKSASAARGDEGVLVRPCTVACVWVETSTTLADILGHLSVRQEILRVLYPKGSKS